MENTNEAGKYHSGNQRIGECPICSEEVKKWRFDKSVIVVICTCDPLDVCQSSTLWGEMLLFL